MPPNLLRGLIVFSTAARYLSFKMAADELCITPSAVSHQIKALEDRVGKPLFERRTRAIVLTAPGAALYSQLDPLLRALDGVTASFFGRRGQPHRTLRIALLPFFASEMFIPLLDHFTEDHPTIDLRIETTQDRGADVLPGSDASVLLLSEQPEKHRAYPLFPLRLVPACAPRLAHKDLFELIQSNDAPLIIHRSRPDAWSEWFRAVGRQLDAQPRMMYLDSMFTVARAAEQGLGVALVPTPLIDAWFQSRALIQLSDTELDTGERYYFVHKKEVSSDPDIVALREWVTTTFTRPEKRP